MQRAITASWLVARPHVNVTVGDVEWWMVGSPPGTDWSERIRLWERDGEVVAWGWFNPPSSLDWHVRADVAPHQVAALAPEVLDWFADRAARWAAEPAAPGEPARDSPDRLEAYALDGDERVSTALGRAGYVRAATPSYSHWYRRLTDDPAPPIVPAGYTLRHVRGPAEIEARVDVHRAAFAPSRMTEAKYERLLSMEHYAFERDLVVEAPDGSLAAFTMVWWDPVARVGEFEPVGVHPSHRRRGLGKAINLAGLRLLRDVGAIDALVFSECANAASEALYASVGFQRATYHRTWTRLIG
jgi:predicted N-acetyltransferase YhbS